MLTILTLTSPLTSLKLIIPIVDALTVRMMTSALSNHQVASPEHLGNQSWFASRHLSEINREILFLLQRCPLFMLDLHNFHRLPFAWIPLETTNVLHWLWHSGNQSQFHISHLPQLVNAQCHSHFFECYNLSHSPTDVGLLVLSTGRSVVGGLFIKWIFTSDVWSNADLPQQLQRAWLLLQHLIVLCFEFWSQFIKSQVMTNKWQLWGEMNCGEARWRLMMVFTWLALIAVMSSCG